MKPMIVGWSHLPFGKLDDLDLEELIVRAATGALDDADIAASEVDGVWVGNLNGGLVPDIFCSSLALNAHDDLRWTPATRVENACASGAAALYAACDAIESGRTQVALVIGAESMTRQTSAEVAKILAGCSYVKEDEEGVTGFHGRLPVNPSGGLKSKGHPIGATGVSMHVLAAMLLCGEAADFQVAGAQLSSASPSSGSQRMSANSSSLLATTEVWHERPAQVCSSQ